LIVSIKEFNNEKEEEKKHVLSRLKRERIKKPETIGKKISFHRKG
jgi:hypothetical protein